MYNIKIYLQLGDMVLHLIFALHAKNGEQKLIETKKRQSTNSSKKRMGKTIVNSKRSKNNVVHSPTKNRVFTTHGTCCGNAMSNLILRVCREYFSS